MAFSHLLHPSSGGSAPTYESEESGKLRRVSQLALWAREIWHFGVTHTVFFLARSPEAPRTTMTVLSLSSTTLGNSQHLSRTRCSPNSSSVCDTRAWLLAGGEGSVERSRAELSQSSKLAPLELCHYWRGSDTHPPEECISADILSGGFVQESSRVRGAQSRDGFLEFWNLVGRDVSTS